MKAQNRNLNHKE